MSRRQVVPPRDILASMLADDMTQQAIADEWGRVTNTYVSRSAVAMAIKRMGLTSAHQRPRYDDVIPWRVRQEHRNDWNVRMLRLCGQKKRGKELDPESARWLQGWLERDLRGGECVVSYDPVRGFRVVPREPGDGPLTRP